LRLKPDYIRLGGVDFGMKAINLYQTVIAAAKQNRQKNQKRKNKKTSEFPGHFFLMNFIQKLFRYFWRRFHN
jgi:hypothetical protein